jgi:outer membrane murein-binding lipoprotein Lpp
MSKFRIHLCWGVAVAALLLAGCGSDDKWQQASALASQLQKQIATLQKEAEGLTAEIQGCRNKDAAKTAEDLLDRIEELQNQAEELSELFGASDDDGSPELPIVK